MGGLVIERTTIVGIRTLDHSQAAARALAFSVMQPVFKGKGQVSFRGASAISISVRHPP